MKQTNKIETNIENKLMVARGAGEGKGRTQKAKKYESNKFPVINL